MIKFKMSKVCKGLPMQYLAVLKLAKIASDNGLLYSDYRASDWICYPIKVPLSFAHNTPPLNSKLDLIIMTSLVHI